MNRTRLLALCAGLGLAACQKLDLPPTDRPTDATFWTQPQDAVNVLATCYENLYNAEYFFFNETLSDNAFNKSEVDGSNSRNIAQGSYGTNQARVTNEWGYHYSGIRKCNTLLANLDRIPGLDGALKARYAGEARGIRAYHYFQLLTWYGDVPLVTSEISIGEAQNTARTPRAQVLAAVLADLDAAAAALPVASGYAPEDRGRFSKGAALGLKARVLLYEGRWADVVALTEQLLTGAGGAYALNSTYAGVFAPANENNAEVLLDVQYLLPARTHAIQRYFIPRTEGRLVSSIAPSQELVNDYLTLSGFPIADARSGYVPATPYLNRDPRLTATVVYDGYAWRRPDNTTFTIRTLAGTGDNGLDRQDASPTGYYVAKYFDPTADASLNSGLNLILLRYADVLLMHAEAKNELSQFTAAEWDRTIRPLRARAGFVAPAALAFPGGTPAELRAVVRRERRAELAMEGLRVFDIRRWRTAETVLNGALTGVAGPVDTRAFNAGRHYLWPVPQRERDINPNLGQNPGW